MFGRHADPLGRKDDLLEGLETVAGRAEPRVVGCARRPSNSAPKSRGLQPLNAGFRAADGVSDDILDPGRVELLTTLRRQLDGARREHPALIEDLEDARLLTRPFSRRPRGSATRPSPCVRADRRGSRGRSGPRAAPRGRHPRQLHLGRRIRARSRGTLEAPPARRRPCPRSCGPRAPTPSRRRRSRRPRRSSANVPPRAGNRARRQRAGTA